MHRARLAGGHLAEQLRRISRNERDRVTLIRVTGAWQNPPGIAEEQLGRETITGRRLQETDERGLVVLYCRFTLDVNPVDAVGGGEGEESGLGRGIGNDVFLPFPNCAWQVDLGCRRVLRERLRGGQSSHHQQPLEESLSDDHRLY